MATNSPHPHEHAAAADVETTPAARTPVLHPTRLPRSMKEQTLWGVLITLLFLFSMFGVVLLFLGRRTKVWFGRLATRTVHLFAGKMGNGKTVNSISEVVIFHRLGFPVWINQPLKREPPDPFGFKAPIFYYTDPRDMPSMGRWMLEHQRVNLGTKKRPEWVWQTRPQDEGKEDEKREGLVVLDEAALVKNARDFKSFTTEDLAAFVNIRKLHITAIICAQGFGMTDLNIRRVASSARIYEGGRAFPAIAFGMHRYPYTEYEVDENGEIIKALEEPVYISARRKARWFTKDVYDLYDTDFLFADAPQKTWPSAVGFVPPRPALR